MFHILEGLGSGYTMKNLEDENNINLVYISYCISFLNDKRERDAMKAKGMNQVYYQNV